MPRNFFICRTTIDDRRGVPLFHNRNVEIPVDCERDDISEILLQLYKEFGTGKVAVCTYSEIKKSKDCVNKYEGLTDFFKFKLTTINKEESKQVMRLLEERFGKEFYKEA